MNVFNLFETKDAESIKLGLQVIKTLNKQEEFKTKMGVTYEHYCNIFENVFLVVCKDKSMNWESSLMHNYKFNLDKMNTYSNANVLIKYPELIDYFSIKHFSGREIEMILSAQPHLFYKFSTISMSPRHIVDMLISQKHLIDLIYIDFGIGFTISELAYLFSHHPELKQHPIIKDFMFNNLKFFKHFYL